MASGLLPMFGQEMTDSSIQQRYDAVQCLPPRTAIQQTLRGTVSKKYDQRRNISSSCECESDRVKMSEVPKLYPNKPKKGFLLLLFFHYIISLCCSFFPLNFIVYIKQLTEYEYSQVMVEIECQLFSFSFFSFYWILLFRYLILFDSLTAHLKLLREEHPESSAFASASPAMSSSTPPGNPGGAPLPQPPKESFARRYKFMWPLLLAVNFTAGGIFPSFFFFFCPLSILYFT